MQALHDPSQHHHRAAVSKTERCIFFLCHETGEISQQTLQEEVPRVIPGT
jgi:hypothetical protein